MLVNFGMVEPFKWEKAYVIPTGSTVLSQWEYLKANRWQHLSDIGRFNEAYWKSFEKNYVEPLAAIEVPGIAESGKVCTCSYADFAYPANKEAPQVRHELLNLPDIFDIAKHTYALPAMSPFFKKRLGFVGEDVTPWWMRCMCGSVVSAVKLERNDVLASEVGLEALRRAPLAVYSRSFFPAEGGRAIGNIIRSEIPRVEIRWGVARFARLAAKHKKEIYFREWSSQSIQQMYWETNRHYPMKSDAVVSILLQMACSQDTMYYPSRTITEMFANDESLDRLFAMVLAFSAEEHENRQKPSQKSEHPRSPLTKFATMVKAADGGMDYDLLRSMHEFREAV